MGFVRLPIAANVFVRAFKLSIEGRIIGGNEPRNASIRQAHRIEHPMGLGRLPAAANVFVRAFKLSIEGRIVGCFNGVWVGGSIGALLLLAEEVTPLLLKHSRRVRLPYHALHVEPGP